MDIYHPIWVLQGMSPFLSFSRSLSPHLPIYPSTYLPFYLSTCLSIYLSIYLNTNKESEWESGESGAGRGRVLIGMPCTSHRIALAIFPVFHAFHTALLHDFVQASCLHQSMPMKTPGVSGGSREVHPQTLSCLFDKLWLVVYLPLWKIWVCQLGWWHSQSMESHKSHVPKHIFRHNS